MESKAKIKFTKKTAYLIIGVSIGAILLFEAGYAFGKFLYHFTN
ncbi:hypothetical protein [Aquimarina sp. MMG016]|nr:hypothetical protein [Aquimarina sp. MMG016]